jgi:hypothetical protein
MSLDTDEGSIQVKKGQLGTSTVRVRREDLKPLPPMTAEQLLATAMREARIARSRQTKQAREERQPRSYH